MDSKKGTVVSGIDPVLAEIQKRLQTHPQEWLKALQENPGAFANLKRKSIMRSRGWPIASWLGCWPKQPRLPSSPTPPKKVAPTDPKRKLRGGGPRPLRVRLLGGLLIYVMTIYCSPARRTGNGRGREGSGLYPELGVLGIQEGKSPALIRDVGRLTALLPSYETVQQESAERGLKLNIKEVHGIGQYAGQAALAQSPECTELDLTKCTRIDRYGGCGALQKAANRDRHRNGDVYRPMILAIVELQHRSVRDDTGKRTRGVSVRSRIDSM